MPALLHALRLAVRGLLRARGTSFIAMLTLGAGLAAAVALLGVVDAGTRSLPVPDGGDIVALELRDARADRVPPPVPLSDWAFAPGVLDAGAVRQISGTLVHQEHGALRGYGAALHPSVLRLLRVPPALGRLPGEDAADATTVVLGWKLYRELGGTPALIGERVDLDGVVHTVIGVMPEGFGFPENHGFWTVLPAHESGEVVARLAPGADRRTVGAAAGARLDALAAAAGREGAPHRVAPLRWTTSRGDSRDEIAAFAALTTLVTLLLLVCCANVATLLLVRGTERAGLLAVQRALGASRRRVTFQLFLESLVIAVGGGAAGLAGGFFMLRWMQLNLSSHWGYYWMTMEVRPPVLLGTAALVMLAALLAGTIPAVRASRVDLLAVLGSQGRGRGDPRQRRLGRWFVGAQVALSSLGLIAAVYLGAEFAQLGRVTERLPLDAVAVARLTLPDAAYDDPAARAHLVERLRAELRRVPGVTAASVSGGVPGGPGPVARVVLPGDAPDAPPRRVQWVPADDRLQGVYAMRLVAGQPLTAETGGSAAGVVVTAGFAQRHFDGPALGQPLRLAGVHADDEWAEVVGVVDDWFPDLRGEPSERVFVPLAAAWRAPLYVSLATAGDAGAVLGGIRGAVRAVDERIPVEDAQTLRARMDWFLRMHRVLAGFGVLGGVGSALVAAVGLYGVMSFQVRTRRREIGVRMAVGAGARRIVLEVVRESVLRVAPGLAVGVTIAMAAVPLLGRGAAPGETAGWLLSLAGVSAIAAGVLLAIGVLAAAEPALRAARLHPQDVLRSD